MSLKTKEELPANLDAHFKSTKISENIFSKDYVDFLSDAGWRLEKKLPSNSNKYSDLLEDTDWKSNEINLRRCHYKRNKS